MYARLGKYSEGIECVARKRKSQNAARNCATSKTIQADISSHNHLLRIRIVYATGRCAMI